MYVRVYSRPQIKVGGKKESHILPFFDCRVRAGRAGFKIPAGTRDLSLLRIFQTGSGALPASCLMGTRVLSWG